jgi:Tfp pilus assembly protein PilO
MLHATVARVDEDDVPRLRSWLAGLSSRLDELRGSYRQQGTRQELFLLVRTRRAPLLVIIAEVEDVEHASHSFLRSQLPIDLEFKELFQELSPEQAEVELLYDSTQYLGPPTP